MNKKDVLKTNNGIYRILDIKDNRILAIDCKRKNMPKYYEYEFFESAELLDETVLSSFYSGDISPKDESIAHRRFAMIADAVAVADDEKKRCEMIRKASLLFGVSKQSLRKYLCTYLAYDNILSLAPARVKSKELTSDQKNMRWALNKFYYTRNKNSLTTAYTMMLKEKYCNIDGKLLAEYPTYNQFRYFFRKTRKMETYYISRNGIKDYQRNNRPLVGDGVQEFAPCIGTAMLDSTICDIYLVDDAGRLVGRPILVAACDANTSMCLGYSLLWEGGTYSLQSLMLNILNDKVALCEKMGISITKEQWDVNRLPSVLITDGGNEYKSQQFSQITELGVSIVNLPPYRPDLKGCVEKFFDLVQNTYKDILKGRGVIMPDFRERGARDYRKDASLTISEFERIVVRCIIHYNCNRVIHNYPYSSKMLEEGVRPNANAIWNYKSRDESDCLIDVSKNELIYTLLPRTTGNFTRYGLKVNGLRYYSKDYKENFLKGGECIVAYNPDNCSFIWLKERNGKFVQFTLIESRFADMPFTSVADIKQKQKKLEDDAIKENYNAKIELISFIENVASGYTGKVDTKGIRAVRHSVARKSHKDIGGELDD